MRRKFLILSLLVLVIIPKVLDRDPPQLPCRGDRVQLASRHSESEKGKRVTMWVTAYTAGPESTGKSPGHPFYGVTASGTKVREWRTVAAGNSIPFGTKIYIPAFKDKPNGGIFVVEDRGEAVGDDELDIYMERVEDALEWGRRQLEVFILEGDP